MAPTGRKRRASAPPARPASVPPAQRPSSSSSSSPAIRTSSSQRVMSVASAVAAEKAGRLANAVQVSIPFGTVEKYQIGLKILLPDTIYGSIGDVSHLVGCHLFCFFLR
jgi:hypothetical protein